MTEQKTLFSQVCHRAGLLSFRINCLEREIQTAIELLCTDSREDVRVLLHNQGLRNKADIWQSRMKQVFPDSVAEVSNKYEKLKKLIERRNDLIHAACATIDHAKRLSFNTRDKKIINSRIETIPISELDSLISDTEKLWLWFGGCVDFIDEKLGYPR